MMSDTRFMMSPISDANVPANSTLALIIWRDLQAVVEIDMFMGVMDRERWSNLDVLSQFLAAQKHEVKHNLKSKLTFFTSLSRPVGHIVHQSFVLVPYNDLFKKKRNSYSTHVQ